MPTADYRVTIVFDYSAEWDDDKNEPDDDYLHDAIIDSFDTIDLEFETEHPMYDEESGDELDDTFTVTVNCDNLRDVDVLKLDS